jgi:excisionase family DNA binding protein
MKETYTLDEAVIYLNTSATTLGELLTKAVIPAAKIGQSWVIRHEDLNAYLRAEVERQTLQRLEQINRGEKPRVATGSRRTPKPNLDQLAA